MEKEEREEDKNKEVMGGREGRRGGREERDRVGRGRERREYVKAIAC